MKSISRAAAFAAAISPFSLSAQLVEQLKNVEVTANRVAEQDSEAAAEARVASVPGGASVVTPDDWTGRTIAPEEIFQFDPGVFARSRGVGNDTRISVRGSGLQRQFGDRGLTLLLDGIPANDADGSFYFRAIDPLSISHIETYRGANGLAYGGGQLGGAINIVQKNGLTDPGTFLQLEGGEFETYRGHLSHAGSNDRWDWFLGYSYAESDGYRERSGWENNHITANLGYHWSDTSLTRFYFLFNDSNAELTGSLNFDQFRDDPRQAGANRTDEADRDLTTLRLGQRTEWETQNGQWSFYTNYQYINFDHLINEGLFRFNRLVDYNSDHVQVGIRGEENYELFGLESTVRFDTRYEYGDQKEGGFGGFVVPGRPASLIDRNNIATNFQFYLENDLTFADKHHFILGGGFVSNRREVDIGSGDTTEELEGTLTDDGVTYRIGYLYEQSDEVQFFANFSQSFEGSPFSEVGSSLDPRFDTLDPQIARTFEIGTRFENSWVSGELTLYRSMVDDTFVHLELPGNIPGTINLDTRQQGVEAGLSVNISGLLGSTGGPSLFFDQSYQYHDFEIDEGNNKGNFLPGIPEHVYSGRLRLEDANQAWKVSLAAEWLDGFEVNNENTIDTDGFVNWRLYGEIRLREGATLYGGVDNLFDEDFVNSVAVNPSSDEFINPSTGRSIYAGLKFQF